MQPSTHRGLCGWVLSAAFENRFCRIRGACTQIFVYGLWLYELCEQSIRHPMATEYAHSSKPFSYDISSEWNISRCIFCVFFANISGETWKVICTTRQHTSSSGPIIYYMLTEAVSWKDATHQRRIFSQLARNASSHQMAESEASKKRHSNEFAWEGYLSMRMMTVSQIVK